MFVRQTREKGERGEKEGPANSSPPPASPPSSALPLTSFPLFHPSFSYILSPKKTELSSVAGKVFDPSHSAASGRELRRMLTSFLDGKLPAETLFGSALLNKSPLSALNVGGFGGIDPTFYDIDTLNALIANYSSA
jgi:hypothetical protein